MEINAQNPQILSENLTGVVVTKAFEVTWNNGESKESGKRKEISRTVTAHVSYGDKSVQDLVDGDMATAVIRLQGALRGLPEAEFVAICDRFDENGGYNVSRDDVGKKPEVPSMARIESALDNGDIDEETLLQMLLARQAAKKNQQ